MRLTPLLASVAFLSLRECAPERSPINPWQMINEKSSDCVRVKSGYFKPGQTIDSITCGISNWDKTAELMRQEAWGLK